MKKYRIGLFAGYILCVLWITLIDRVSTERRAMLVPFWEFASIVKGVERSFYIGQILGNLTMLMPMGFMLPMLRKTTLKQVLLTAFLFSAFIEITQYITCRGLMEFDDVFNNTVGAVFGYWVFKAIQRKSHRPK